MSRLNSYIGLVIINEIAVQWQSTDDDPMAVSSSNCVRKLETISHYVASIFENNFKEAKKNLNSAYRALRDPRARLHLCTCLQRYVKRNQVNLMNFKCKISNKN